MRDDSRIRFIIAGPLLGRSRPLLDQVSRVAWRQNAAVIPLAPGHLEEEIARALVEEDADAIITAPPPTDQESYFRELEARLREIGATHAPIFGQVGSMRPEVVRALENERVVRRFEFGLGRGEDLHGTMGSVVATTRAVGRRYRRPRVAVRAALSALRTPGPVGVARLLNAIEDVENHGVDESLCAVLSKEAANNQTAVVAFTNGFDAGGAATPDALVRMLARIAPDTRVGLLRMPKTTPRGATVALRHRTHLDSHCAPNVLMRLMRANDRIERTLRRACLVLQAAGFDLVVVDAPDTNADDLAIEGQIVVGPGAHRHDGDFDLLLTQIRQQLVDDGKEAFGAEPVTSSEGAAGTGGPERLHPRLAAKPTLKRSLIKQYGLERSGTNYVRALLEANYDVRVFANLFGHKHQKFGMTTSFLKHYDYHSDFQVTSELPMEAIDAYQKRIENGELRFVITFKNPCSWCVSYHKFLGMVGKAPKGPMSLETLRAYVDQWNDFNGNWYRELVELREDRTIGVLYEDLLANPEATVRRIAMKLGLEPITEAFSDIDRYMNLGGDTGGSSYVSSRAFTKRDYYLNRAYMSDLSPEHLRIIDERVDHDLDLKIQGLRGSFDHR